MSVAQESIFVGRAAEQTTLRWAMDRTRGGERQLVLIVGEPGVGKSRLARRVAEVAAADHGIVVHVARCWQWGGAPAMWPWVQIFREICMAERRSPEQGLADECDRLLDRLAAKNDGGGGGGLQSRFALFDDAMTLLAASSASRPLLIHIDDVHAADPTSIDLLRFFARDARPASVMIVGTVRDVDADSSDEASALIDDLYRESTVVKLHGLADDELGNLVEEIADERPVPAVVAALQRRTGGNPLFIDGLVRAAIAEGGLDRLVTGDHSIPPGIRGAIEKRMRNFCDGDRWILAAVAAIGRDCPAELVATVTENSMAVVGAVFGRAVSEALLVETPPGGGKYAFSHALLADVIYLQLDSAHRMRLHEAIARALEQALSHEIEHHASELARHYLSAGRGEVLRRGIELAIMAGDRAHRVFAYDEAAGFYERALEAMELGDGAEPEDKGRALLKLGHALLLSGRPESARATLRRLVRLDPGDELFAEVALCMAQTGEFAVTHDEAIQLLSQAEERLSDRKDIMRIRVLSRLAAAGWTDQSSLERRRELTQTAIELAEELGDLRALAVALAARMSALSDPDHLEERLQGVERLLSAAKACGDLPLVFEVNRWRINAYWEAGDRVNADAALDEYQRLAEQLRWPQARMNAALRRAVLAEMTGDLPRLERELHQVQDLGRLARDPQVDMYVAVGRVTLSRGRGDLNALRDNLPMARAGCNLWRQLPAPAGLLLEMLLAVGHIEEARALFERYAADDFASIPIGFGTVAAYAMFAEGCVALGDVERAPILRDLLAPFAEHNAAAGLSTCKGSASRYIAKLDLLLGDIDRAIGNFEKALRINRRIGARGFLAYTLRDYAGALNQRGRADDQSRAATLCTEARALAEELGFVALMGELSGAPRAGEEASVSVIKEYRLVREGESWLLAFEDKTVRLRDSRGMQYLYRVIDKAGSELHALELSAGQGAAYQSDAGPAFDQRARAEYQSRVEQLRDDLAEAERFNDPARADRARAELDAIASELAEGLGLGGRIRRSGSTSERARVAVSRAIKRAIEKIGKEHRAAGAHLERFIKTGTYCCYDPAPGLGISWVLSDS